MTRYALTFMRFACPSCDAESLVQPVRSINTLVEGLAMPSTEALGGRTTCHKCGKQFSTGSAEFLGWLNENTPPDPADVEKYAVPAFLRKQP